MGYSLTDAIQKMTDDYCTTGDPGLAKTLAGLVSADAQDYQLTVRQRELDAKKEADMKKLDNDLEIRKKDLENKKAELENTYNLKLKELEIRQAELEAKIREADAKKEADDKRLEQEAKEAVRNRRLEIARLALQVVSAVGTGTIMVITLAQGDAWQLLKRSIRIKSL